MRLYNIEIFDSDMKYRSSAQTSEFDYSFDYMDVEKNSVAVPKIIAQKGDFIRITSGMEFYSGIVSDVTIETNHVEIQYKPFHKIFDVKFYALYEKSSVEETLAKWIADYYVVNPDFYQNIDCLHITTQSNTPGALLEAPGVVNLYDMVLQAFTYYGIVCEFEIDVQNKTLELRIGASTAQKFTIEAGLTSVIEKEITIKEADESTNKLIIYNELDPTENVTYYRSADDQITTTPDERVVPVVCEVAIVKVSGSKTFEEVALQKAQGIFKDSKYDNLIEIEVLHDDQLVRPRERKIGQNCDVIVGDRVYSTILTGIVIAEHTRLIFGSIRLELTKQLKKRFRQEDVNR